MAVVHDWLGQTSDALHLSTALHARLLENTLNLQWHNMFIQLDIYT